jgi:hypothetical protein
MIPAFQRDRLVAIHQLSPKDPEGEKTLCQVVQQDPDLELRMTAARSLGAGGGAASLPALTSALESCFVARSGSAHKFSGFAILAAALAAVAICWTGTALHFWESLGSAISVFFLLFGAGLLAGVAIYSTYQSRRRELIRTLGEAILAVTERTRSAEAHTIVKTLRVTAGDVLQTDGKTREVARDVADRLERLTEIIKHLPVPSAPALTSEVLPRPADPPAVSPEALPRVGR